MNLDKLQQTLNSILEDLSAMNVALSEAAEALDTVADDVDCVAGHLCKINEALGEGK